MKFPLLISFLLLANGLSAQWESIGGSTSVGFVLDLEYVLNEDRLYTVGNMQFIGDSLKVNGTAFYENGQWYTMGTGVVNPFNGLVRSVHDVLVLDTAVVVCGEFNMIDSPPLGFGRYDQWASHGSLGSIRWA